jgi:hypothetical protein
LEVTLGETAGSQEMLSPILRFFLASPGAWLSTYVASMKAASFLSAHRGFVQVVLPTPQLVIEDIFSQIVIFQGI